MRSTKFIQGVLTGVALASLVAAAGLTGCAQEDKLIPKFQAEPWPAPMPGHAAHGTPTAPRFGAQPAVRAQLLELPVGTTPTIAVMPGQNAVVQVKVEGIELVDPAAVAELPRPHEGHLHYQIDGRPPIIATTEARLAFFGMSPGQHTIEVMLAGNDHSPLGPRTALTVTDRDERQNVRGEAPETDKDEAVKTPKPGISKKDDAFGKARPTEDLLLQARLVDPEMKAKKKATTVEVDVEGVQLVEPWDAGFEARPGQAHLEYQLDGGVVVATTAKKLSFHDLEPGAHRLVVRLAGNDRSTLGPEQALLVTIPLLPGSVTY
jgi:hypothetical protein